MWQAMAAQAAAQIVGGLFGQGEKDVQNLNNATLQVQANEDAYIDNSATNKAIAEANLKNQIRTAFRVGMNNVARGQAKKAQAQQGINLGAAKAKAMSATTANAAAAGSIGSSVDSAAFDIMQQAEMADASIVEDGRIQQENFDTDLHDILQAGQDALQSAQTIRLRAVAQPQKSRSLEVWLGATANVASNYAAARMSLGAGKSSGSGSGSSGPSTGSSGG